MGIFSNLFPKREKAADVGQWWKLLDGYSPIWHSWGGQIYESELVRSSIDAKARHISKLQPVLYGSAQPSLQTRLKHEPNTFMTWGKFLYRLSTILDVRNTAFIVPVLDKYGTTTGYFPICPDEWQLVEYDGKPWLRFHFPNGDRSAIELMRVGIMTRFQYRSDLFGENNGALKDTMELIHIQRQSIEESAKNSASYKFMAKVANFSMAGDLAKERQRFDAENFQNGGGGMLLFPNTYNEIKQISSQAYSVDADEQKLIQDNVYNYFGVNEKILQNSANGDELDAFFNGAIEPFSIQLSDVMTQIMFSRLEQSNGSRIVFSANRLQYMSTTNKITMAKELADRGVLMIDEIRELFNYPPLPDGYGEANPIRGEYYMIQEGKESNDE